MRRGLVILAAALPAAGCSPPKPAPAPPPPSVLVTTVAPAQGSLPDVITAYGVATPSLNGSQVLSVPVAGQVARLAATPGAAVRAGQPLLTFAVAPSALSSYAQAVTALATARKQRATTAQLLSQSLATRDQLAQADKAVADAAAALQALAEEGAGQATRTLTAPFDGVVTTVSAAQGDRPQPGAALLTLARASGLVVTVGVDPAARARVRVGQGVSLERLSGGPAIPGRVLRIDSALNPRTRQVDVDVGFPVGRLLTGEALRVDIRVGDVAGWLAPHRAVVTANGAARVYQVVGGKAKAVDVTVALSTPEQDVVEGPLDPARPLIVDGAYQVEDGATVRGSGR